MPPIGISRPAVRQGINGIEKSADRAATIRSASPGGIIVGHPFHENDRFAGLRPRPTEQIDGHLTECGDPQAANHLGEVEDNVYFPEVSVTLAPLWVGRNPSASALPAMSRT